MDPTANLKRQVELAQDILHNGVEGYDKPEELAELVLDLHEWLSKGGFLPQPWQRKGDANGV